MRVFWVILALIVIFAIALPLLHLVAAVAVVVCGAIVVMAAWKVLFGPSSSPGEQGGPPAKL